MSSELHEAFLNIEAKHKWGAYFVTIKVLKGLRVPILTLRTDKDGFSVKIQSKGQYLNQLDIALFSQAMAVISSLTEEAEALHAGGMGYIEATQKIYEALS